MESALLRDLVDFGNSLTEGELLRLGGALATLSLETFDATSGAGSSSLVSRATRADLARLLNEIKIHHPELLGKQLHTLLIALRAQAGDTQQSSVNLAWTGPRSPSLPLRRTEQVLTELIDDAKTELFVIAFAFYKAENVKNALLRAIARGVQVTMLMESAADEDGTTDFDMVTMLQNQLGPAVKFLEWPADKREQDEKGNRGALHVKCAIADRARAFVTSANLTAFAMTFNMELGVELREATLVQRLVSHFDYLESNRVLLRR
jgi:phosphatidylserine/phosphatidylglycerophosphate/cardiolipin synthase-like enzyme